MMGIARAPQPDPCCTICDGPIRPGDSVAGSLGGMQHLNCWIAQRQAEKLDRGQRDEPTPVADLLQNPVCPRCSSPISPGQHVYFGDGVLVHLRCGPGAPQANEVVAKFLKENGGADFCHGCLAKSTGLPLDDVRRIVMRLRLSAMYHVSIAQPCAGCTETHLTVRVDVPRL
jgi:hypothetical protein